MSKIQGLLLLVSIALSGCSSRSVDLHYYMLSSPQAKQYTQPDSDTVVMLAEIQLPDYFRQRQLAMQTGNTTLHFAPQHVWSTPQDEAISKLLTSGLRQRQIAVHTTPAQTTSTVTVVIDDFIATWQGELILKGEYRIETAQQTRFNTFDYRVPLQEDGFAHSVAKMRALIHKLSQQLSHDLQQE